jgi:hypothetical protein
MLRLSDGRVQRSRDEWRKIMDRFRSSGLSEAALCRCEKLSPSLDPARSPVNSGDLPPCYLAG